MDFLTGVGINICAETQKISHLLSH